MTSVLLDSNVLSELVRLRPEPRVVEFVRSQPRAIVSVLTLHEFAYGAARVKDAKRRKVLEDWLTSIHAQFADSIAEVDAGIAVRAGRLRAELDQRGRHADIVDALLAATALERGARVATRNVRDFEPLGVDVVDPWSA